MNNQYTSADVRTAVTIAVIAVLVLVSAVIIVGVGFKKRLGKTDKKGEDKGEKSADKKGDTKKEGKTLVDGIPNYLLTLGGYILIAVMAQLCVPELVHKIFDGPNGVLDWHKVLGFHVGLAALPILWIKSKDNAIARFILSLVAIGLIVWVLVPGQVRAKVTGGISSSHTGVWGSSQSSGRPIGETLKKESLTAYPDVWNSYTLDEEYSEYRLSYPNGGRVMIKAPNGREQVGSNSQSEVNLGSTPELSFSSLSGGPVTVDVEYTKRRD